MPSLVPSSLVGRCTSQGPLERAGWLVGPTAVVVWLGYQTSSIQERQGHAYGPISCHMLQRT